MALIKSGALAVQVSGKIDGLVFARNRGGAYVRANAQPTNPNTAGQTIYRNRLSGLSSSWRALTSFDRASWDAVAATRPVTNRLGDQVYLSGFQTYISNNLNRKLLLESTTDPAPAVDDAPTIDNIVIDAVGDDNLVNQKFEVTVTALDGVAAQALACYCTGPLSQGVDFIRPSDYRFMASTSADAPSVMDILAAWEFNYGDLNSLQVGQKVVVKVVPLSENRYADAERRADGTVAAFP